MQQSTRENILLVSPPSDQITSNPSRVEIVGLKQDMLEKISATITPSRRHLDSECKLSGQHIRPPTQGELESRPDPKGHPIIEFTR